MSEPLWSWGILGLILLAIEMATGTFYILWFGLAALLLSLALYLFPTIPIAWQFFLFAALSIGALAIWKRYYKKTSPDSRIGQSQGDEIGRVGTIIESVSPNQNGKIRFAQGIMGSREWVAIADETLEIDAEAMIVSIEGNSLRVKRH